MVTRFTRMQNVAHLNSGCRTVIPILLMEVLWFFRTPESVPNTPRLLLHTILSLHCTAWYLFEMCSARICLERVGNLKKELRITCLLAQYGTQDLPNVKHDLRCKSV
jgi:hypothetical protein